MAVSKDEILDAIAKMSLMDVVDLIADMEKQYGVPAEEIDKDRKKYGYHSPIDEAAASACDSNFSEAGRCSAKYSQLWPPGYR